MGTPESIKPHAGDYKDQSWRLYTVEELGNWVHLLVKRAANRANPEKRTKDLLDARNYLAMIEAHISEAEKVVCRKPCSTWSSLSVRGNCRKCGQPKDAHK